jgi:hypothetical protein
MAVLFAMTACAPHPAQPAPKPTTHLTTAPRPTPTPESTYALGSDVVDTVVVTAYPGTQFNSKHGCGCKLKDDSTDELFPSGTPVVLLKITLTGAWKPSQGSQNTQDVTGASLSDTKFDGRPEKAVLDGKDGPAVAKHLGLPWLPEGLFAGESAWTIQNKQPSAFAAAWYVPKGVDHINLVVDIPSEGQPSELDVKLPDSVLDLINRSQE